MKHGVGKHVNAKGEVYEGDFANDAKTGKKTTLILKFISVILYILTLGKGKFVDCSGRILEGDWLENMMHG